MKFEQALEAMRRGCAVARKSAGRTCSAVMMGMKQGDAPRETLFNVEAPWYGEPLKSNAHELCSIQTPWMLCDDFEIVWSPPPTDPDPPAPDLMASPNDVPPTTPA